MHAAFGITLFIIALKTIVGKKNKEPLG